MQTGMLLECSLACIICVVLAQRFAAYWNYQMIRCLLVDGSLPETFCPRNSAVWNHLKDSLLESLVESSLVTSWPSNKVTVVCWKSSLSTISERISWMCFLTIWSNPMTNNSCHSLKIDRFDRYWYWLCCKYPFISTCVNVSEICLDSRNGSMHVNTETWENALHVMFSQDLLFLFISIIKDMDCLAWSCILSSAGTVPAELLGSVCGNLEKNFKFMPCHVVMCSSKSLQAQHLGANTWVSDSRTIAGQAGPVLISVK